MNGDYFTALGIPLREGRFLTSEDSHRPERVCVVDEDFAKRYWPNGQALGQRLAHGNESDEAKLFTVVGVVGAVKQAELTEAPGQGAVYLPFAHHGNASVFVVVRTSQSPEAFAETLRKVVRTTQSEIAIDNLRSMETRVADSLLARPRPRCSREFSPASRCSWRRLELTACSVMPSPNAPGRSAFAWRWVRNEARSVRNSSR